MRFEILGLLVRDDEQVKVLPASGWLAGEIPARDPRLAKSTDELGLSTRAAQAVRGKTVRDLLGPELYKTPGLGRKYRREIEAALHRLGLYGGTVIRN